MLVVHQQLHGSHERNTQAACTPLFLVYIFSFQITKRGNVELINTVKKFHEYSRPRKYFV